MAKIPEAWLEKPDPNGFQELSHLFLDFANGLARGSRAGAPVHIHKGHPDELTTMMCGASDKHGTWDWLPAINADSKLCPKCLRAMKRAGACH